MRDSPSLFIYETSQSGSQDSDAFLLSFFFGAWLGLSQAVTVCVPQYEPTVRSPTYNAEA